MLTPLFDEINDYAQHGKRLLLWLMGLATLVAILPHLTLAHLKHVKPVRDEIVIKDFIVKSPDQFEIVFNKKPDLKIIKHFIQVEWMKDILQFTFTPASIYPAQIKPLEDSLIQKAFIYQYAPHVVRCRFSLKQSADTLKDKTHWEWNLNRFILSIGPLTAQASPLIEKQALTPVVGSKALLQDQEQNAEGEELREGLAVGLGVVKPDPSLVALAQVPQELKKDLVTDATPFEGVSREVSHEVSLGQNGKGSQSVLALKLFLKLGIVFLIFGGCVFLFKKFGLASERLAKKHPFFKFLLTRFKTNLFETSQWVQVVARQPLDPKKSLLVVRVSGRLLLLGVTSEKISLLSSLEEPAAHEKTSQEFDQKSWVKNQETVPKTAWPKDAPDDFLNFESTLAGRLSREDEALLPGIRSRIKNRLEGLKPL